MKDIVFATNNPNKLKEIRQILGDNFNVLSLQDINCKEELPETQDTLEGNAIQKAKYVSDNYHVDCFADDTGLEVNALNGEPGVYSARYAGPRRNSEDNMNKLLDELFDMNDRSAQFRTVIALVENNEVKTFEGKVEGTIAEMKSGNAGFGYDPIFIPGNYSTTFSEMSAEEKNKISHRGKAVQKLVEYLKDN